MMLSKAGNFARVGGLVILVFGFGAGLGCRHPATFTTEPVSGRPESSAEWYRQGREVAAAHRQQSLIHPTARNVILFIGDGMSLSTVASARILAGQQQGQSGEENLLAFERLPYTALAKTYNVNQQTPDSAGTMTAIMTGVKTRAGMISVGAEALRGDFAEAPKHFLTTLLELAEADGRSTGVVTTTALTHATPAACFSHTPERGWEDDSSMPEKGRKAGFPDIARQLIEFPYDNGLEVALGGGRIHFFPTSIPDPEDPDTTGARLDNRNLAEEWTRRYPNAQWIWNAEQFQQVDPAQTDHLLGLFQPGHMHYEVDRPGDAAGEPSLSEMTAMAIQILQRNPKGFFLMVEGGRIDHAHHDANAHRALTETIEFASAVHTAMEMTDARDTLVLVTADHSHTLTLSGYATRGNPILGKVVHNNSQGLPEDHPAKDDLDLPYTVLLYANGPGFHQGEGRPDLTNVDTKALDYQQEGAVPFGSETHAGEDVAVYAGGAGASMIRGVLEQNTLFHILASASGLAP